MKKLAGILLIVTSFIQLINNLIAIPDQLDYMEGFNIIMPLFVWPLTNIAFILLGISLLNEKNLPAVSKNETISDEVNLNSNDIPSTGLNIISFLIPIVGLIIYLTEKDKSPRKANSAGKAALWGVGVAILLSVISIIISFSIVNSMY